MIILQIQVADFSGVEREGDPPVTGHRDAPCSGPVAGKLVDAPARRGLAAPRWFDAQQGGVRPDPAHEVASDAFQPLMPESDLMPSCVRFRRTLVKPVIVKPAFVATSGQVRRGLPIAERGAR